MESPVNFNCFWAPYRVVYSDHSLCAQSHNLPIDTLETKAPLQCPGQLRPRQHKTLTHTQKFKKVYKKLDLTPQKCVEVGMPMLSKLTHMQPPMHLKAVYTHM